MAYKVILDAGHGGTDPGATYEGRQEKDDALSLAMAVGELLENAGIEVFYTRTSDVYDTPFEKATKANREGGDLFISIHRNSSPVPNTYDGVQALVYKDTGFKAQVARNINENLVALGFSDKGVVERPNLVVLKRTKMPAVLLEVGFINSDKDNALFDQKFNEIAQAIADGIIDSFGINLGGGSDMQSMPVSQSENREMMPENGNMSRSRDMMFGNDMPENREMMPRRGMSENRKSQPEKDKNVIYRVQVGAFENLDNAVALERQLRALGFDTFIAK